MVFCILNWFVVFCILKWLVVFCILYVDLVGCHCIGGILYVDLVGGIPMSNELTACRVEKALDVGSHLPCILYFARDTVLVFGI